MSAPAVAAGRFEATTRVRRRSWVDALIDAIDRSAVPAWAIYLAVSLVLGVLAIVLRWIDGSVPFPTFNPVTVIFGAASIYPLAVMHYLRRPARRAVKDFRPALGELEPRYDEFERRLTTMPFGAGIAALVIGIVVQAAGLIGSGGGWGITARTSMVTIIVAVVSQQLLNVTFVAYILRAIGQLSTIGTLHREATAIRLWERAPHNAFARFTFATAVAVAVPFALVEVLALLAQESSVLEVVLLGLLIVISAVVFVFPLRGMHRRLVDEKARQVAESDASFELAAIRLHCALESDTFDQVTPLGDAMTALITENERLKRISTWPWSAETLRGFISTIAAPALLWFATTLLGRFLGLN